MTPRKCKPRKEKILNFVEYSESSLIEVRSFIDAFETLSFETPDKSQTFLLNLIKQNTPTKELFYKVFVVADLEEKTLTVVSSDTFHEQYDRLDIPQGQPY